MTYIYQCPKHGRYEVVRKMSEVQPTERCPDCGLASDRVWLPVVDIWRTDGAHKTDYTNDGAIGTKADQLRRQYEEVTGEKAPPPAADVPRSGPKY